MKLKDKKTKCAFTKKVSESLSMKLYAQIIILFAFLFIASVNIQAQFVERNKLTGTGNIGPSGQGRSVSISDDGNTAIVGGPTDNGGAGAAWIFEKNISGNWVQESPKLVGAGAIGNAGQGYSVAISGDGLTAIVGGPYDDNREGAVWFFRRVDAATWLEMGKFVGTVSPLQHCFQGHAVAINYDGTIAIEGGPDYNRLSLPGAVWTFTRSGTVWAQSGSLMTGGAFSGEDTFGYSLSLSADGTAIIGFNGSDTDGKALLITRSGSNWNFGAYLYSFSNANSGISQYFGHSVDISADGNTVIIGTPQYTGNGKYIIGCAFVYKKAGGVWGYPYVIVGTQVFGNCVSVSGDGNKVMLGGPFGGSFIYNRLGGSWVQEGSMLVGSGASQGYSVALSAYSCTAVMGGPSENGGIGAAWLFTCDSPLYAVTVYGSITRNYTDLTSACNAINSGTHGNGNITVLINQSHTLSSSAVLNGEVFTSCIIKPTSEVTISGNLPNALIILNGADNVTIDGRIGLSDEIKLAFTNNYVDDIEMKNGASDNAVKFVSCSPGSYYYGINISQSLPGTGGNNNNSVEDSYIGGFSSAGTSGTSGYANTGIRLLRNKCGIININRETKDIEIRNNNIYSIFLNSVGIINITGNHSSEIKIIPIDLTSAITGNTEINISNNFFSKYNNYSCGCIRCYVDEKSFYFSTEHISIITANICFNTISLTGYINIPCGYEYFIARGSEIHVTTGNVVFKNNIVYCNLNGTTLGSTFNIDEDAKIEADYNSYSYATWYNFTDNINDNKNIDLTDNMKRENSTYDLLNDIDDYKVSAFPNEQHSIFKLPSFQDITTGDLHLAGASIGDNDLKGIPIPGITTDIDNEIRISPYMGADEADFPLPAELSSFTSSVNNNNVLLNWTTAEETNNSGFEIERSIVNSEWSKVNFIKGHGNSTTPQNYSFTDKNLSSGKYKYRLKQIDFNGNFEYHNLSNEVVIGVPEKFSLSQNYPNPFNPVTKISYELRVTNYVSIIIYDVLGNKVGSLVNQKQNAGSYEVEFDGSNLASGAYFYKIQAGDFTAVKKMLLIK